MIHYKVSVRDRYGTQHSALWATTRHVLSCIDCWDTASWQPGKWFLNIATGVHGKLTLVNGRVLKESRALVTGDSLFFLHLALSGDMLLDFLNKWREEGALTEWGFVFLSHVVEQGTWHVALCSWTCCSCETVLLLQLVSSANTCTASSALPHSCFWNSKSCPMKCRFGEMHGRLVFTKS